MKSLEALDNLHRRALCYKASSEKEWIIQCREVRNIVERDLKVLKILKKLIKKVDYVKYEGEMRPKLFINKFSKDLEHDYEMEKIKQWLEEE